MLRQVSEAMQRIAPLCLADRSWDNVGVLIDNPNPKPSNVVLLTIDLTEDVLTECQEKNIGVVVAYHPIIFSPLKSLTLPRQAVVLRTITQGISVYSPHTSLDAMDGGINDWMGSLLDPNGESKPIEALQESIRDKFSPKCGIGRVLRLSESITFATMVNRIKVGLGLKHLRVMVPSGWESPETKKVTTIAICAGSGGSVFRKLSSLQKKVDVLWTGEMGHHEVLAAKADGRAVILCEHTNTERGFLQQRLQLLLQKELGNKIQVLTSSNDKEPLEVW